MTTTTALPNPQWRLINGIYHVRPGGLGTAALRAADAEPADLVALACAGLVRLVSAAGDVIDPDVVAADPGALDHYRVHVGSTSAGLRWVVENPENSALHVVRARGHGRGVLLRDAQAATGVDVSVFVTLAEAGLIRVETGERGDTPIRLQARPTSDMWRLKLTRKGLSLLGT